MCTTTVVGHKGGRSTQEFVERAHQKNTRYARFFFSLRLKKLFGSRNGTTNERNYGRYCLSENKDTRHWKNKADRP